MSNVLKMLNQVKQKYFELGERLQRLLAHQLRHTRAIYSIKSSDGKPLTDLIEINRCVAKFYTEVYLSLENTTPNAAINFLPKLNLPKLNEEAVNLLDVDINLNEITKAISSFPNNKSPSPDGLNIDFYKNFSYVLSPLLLCSYKHCGDTTHYKANIVLIPKPGRDTLFSSSYCPISLIPTKTKLIRKILTDHLMNHICSIIHPNQTGLMPGRNMFFNLRCLFDVLYGKTVQS